MTHTLSRRQRRILYLLSQGKTYNDICLQLSYNREAFHAIVHVIRRKTGIANTKNPAECKAWFSKAPVCAWTKEPLPVSPMQLYAMKRYAMGETYAQIARNMDIGEQGAQNYVSQGCKRAGIIGMRSTRRERVKNFLAARESSASLDPAFI